MCLFSISNSYSSTIIGVEWIDNNINEDGHSPLAQACPQNNNTNNMIRGGECLFALRTDIQCMTLRRCWREK